MAEPVVREVITELHGYLQDNLGIDENIIYSLVGKRLLDKDSSSRIKALLSKGGKEAINELLSHMSLYYNDDQLVKFCDFLEDSSKDARARWENIARKIRKEIRCQQFLRDEKQTDPENKTMQEQEMLTRKEKLKEIVRLYRDSKLELPRNAELEDEYEGMMGLLSTTLTSADDNIRQSMQTRLRLRYKHVVSGVVCAPSPHVPDSGSGLYDFIDSNSSVYDVFLVEIAVKILKNEELTKIYNVYQKSLHDSLEIELKSCEKNSVSLPLLRRGQVHMALAIDEDKVLLALVIQLQEYFVKYIGLQKCILEGFQGGCVISYFAITAVDAVLVAPKILAHLEELKTRFSVTQVVVFGHFAVDVESGTCELLEEGQCMELEEDDDATTVVKGEGEFSELSRKSSLVATTLSEDDLINLKKLREENAHLMNNNAYLEEENAQLKVDKEYLEQRLEDMEKGIESKTGEIAEFYEKSVIPVREVDFTKSVFQIVTGVTSLMRLSDYV